MKLIVDISDEAYELCKRGTTGTFLINSAMRSGKTFLISLYKSIANGTPLTTESLNGDCISRAETQKHIYTRLYETALNNVGYKCEASDLFTDIAENRLSTWVSEILPIPSKPRTGKWLVYQDCEGKTRKCVCNQCGYETGKYTWKNPNFCENCGTKMEAESENGE